MTDVVEAVLLAAVCITMAAALTAYALFGGDFGVQRVMAVVLLGMAVSGCVAVLSGRRRD